MASEPGSLVESDVLLLHSLVLADARAEFVLLVGGDDHLALLQRRNHAAHGEEGLRDEGSLRGEVLLDLEESCFFRGVTCRVDGACDLS